MAFDSFVNLKKKISPFLSIAAEEGRQNLKILKLIFELITNYLFFPQSEYASIKFVNLSLVLNMQKQ